MNDQRGETHAGAARREPSIAADVLPLSYAQQQLWLVDRIHGASPEYNSPLAFRIRGALDRDRLAQAIQSIAARHETLRTRFATRDGEPVQVIEPSVQVPIDWQDWTGHDPEAQQAALTSTLRRQWRMPFDLSKAPLLRVVVLRVDPEDHVVVRTWHHIVSDAWSGMVFERELVALCAASGDGRGNPLPPLTARHADFVRAQRLGASAVTLNERLDYWERQLSGIPEQLMLPSDRPRTASPLPDADVVTASLSPEATAALARLARDERATPFLLLLTAYGVLLAHYTGQEDIVIGTPVANRGDRASQALIGFLINTLPIRIRPRPLMRVRDLVRDMRQTMRDAITQQAVPFTEVVDRLERRRPASAGLFHTMVSMVNMPPAPPTAGGLTLMPVTLTDWLARFDLELYVRVEDGAFRFWWVYRTAFFDRPRIERMAAHYARVLEAIVANPDQKVGSIELLAPAERRQLLVDWACGGSTLPPSFGPGGPPNTLDLVIARAGEVPDALAIITDDESMTYAGVAARTHQVAHYLREAGVRRGDVVGVALARSIDLIPILLGVWEAGAAYLSLEPEYPAARLAAMVAEAAPRLVLMTGEGVALPPTVPVVRLDSAAVAARLAVLPADLPADLGERRSEHDAAYIMYTSGSTGRPKGVVVEHGSLNAFLRGMAEHFPLRRNGRHLALALIGFDISVLDLFMPLCHGATVVLATRDALSDPRAITRLIEQRGVTSVQATPSQWEALLAQAPALAGVHVLCGGEALPGDLATRLVAMSGPVVNVYGPTETTLWATARRVTAADAPDVPLGRPLADYRTYILGPTLEPRPIGVPGELYIAGVGVARGYLGQPARTAERFLPDPYGSPGGRMYRTGDLASWRADGTIAFLGRRDQQVKIRGHRIELGEVEAALRAQPGIAHAIVDARLDPRGKPCLVGYVVADGDLPLRVTDVRAALAVTLPEWMLPAAIVQLDGLPVSPHGKVDRRALPPPEFPSAVPYRAPTSPEHARVCDVFDEVLGVSGVGLDDDFFERGGHSLLAVRLLARVGEIFGVDLPVHALFDAPTPAELTALVIGARSERAHPVM